MKQLQPEGGNMTIRKSLILVAICALAGAAFGAVTGFVSPVSAAAGCIGNQTTVTAPYSCTTEWKDRDGYLVRARYNVTADGQVAVTFETNRPVTAAMPLWVRAHDGKSSDPDVNEGRGTMPAGATTATVTVMLREPCGGQVDARFGTGATRPGGGLTVGGPMIKLSECGPATTPATSVDTTPTTVPPPSTSVPGTTVPGVSTSTPGLSTPPAPPASGGPGGSRPPSGPPLQLPATGGEWVPFVLTAVVLVFVGGLVLVGRNHGKRDDPGRYPR